MSPQDMKVIVVGDHCWGKGDTLQQAKDNARKIGGAVAVRHYAVYVVHPDTTMTEMGDLCYPAAFPPKKIHEVVPARFKRKVKK